MTDPNELIDGRLDDQLRAAGDEWRTARPARSTSVDPMLFAVERAPRSNKALAGVAGVIVIALIAVLIIVALPPRDQRVATNSPSPTTSHAPSPTASGSTGPSPSSPPSPDHTPTPTHAATTPTPTAGIVADWTSVAEPPPSDNGYFRMSVSNGKFLTNGSVCDADKCAYVLSESTDGVTWNEVASLTPDPGPVRGLVITHDDKYGFVAAANPLYQGPGAGMWHSADGQHWDFLGSEPAFDGSECNTRHHDGTDIVSVYATADRLVAVGRIYCEELIFPGTWTSTDGVDWERSRTVPIDLAVAGASGYVGLQVVRASDRQVWHSADGLTWEQVALPQTRIDVAAIEGGFVGLSAPADGSSPTQLLTSPDGVTWSLVDDAFPARPYQPISDGIRAAFAEFSLGNSKAIQVSSPDGRTWDRYVIPDATDLEGAAIIGDRVLAWSSDQMYVADIASSPSPTPAPTATPTVVASPSGTPRVTGSVLALPAEAVKSVEAVIDPIGDDNYAQDASRVAFTTANRTKLQLADLATGFTVDVAQADGNDQILSLDLSGDYVAWAVGHWAGNKDLAPCGTQGSLTWTIWLRDMPAGVQQQIATGTNTDVAACSALPPSVAVDGDLVAYSLEDPRPDLPHATKIVVHAISSNQDVRTLSSDLTVGTIDISDTDVAYIQGTPSDNPYGWLDNTGLILSRGDGTEPTLVTILPENVSLSGGRLVWTTYPQANFPQIWTQQIGSPGFTLVYQDRNRFRGGLASGSGDLVTFATSAGIQIWDATTQRTYSAAASGTTGSSLTSAVDVVSSEGGWLVWAGYQDVNGTIAQRIQGLPLDQVPFPVQ